MEVPGLNQILDKFFDIFMHFLFLILGNCSTCIAYFDPAILHQVSFLLVTQ